MPLTHYTITAYMYNVHVCILSAWEHATVLCWWKSHVTMKWHYSSNLEAILYSWIIRENRESLHHVKIYLYTVPVNRNKNQ